MKQIFLQHRVLSLTGLVIIIGIIGFASVRNGNDVPYEFVEAEKRDIVQTVSVTGRVEPSDQLELAFERTSRIARLPVTIGQEVTRGMVLAEIENGDILAQVLQAEAQVEAAEAELAQLVRGTRPEEISVQEAVIVKSTIAFEDAQFAVINALEDAYTTADDAVRNKVDQFISNPRSSLPQINFSVSDNTLKTKIQNTRPSIESRLSSWRGSLNTLTVNNNLPGALQDATSHLRAIKLFLNDVSLAVNALEAGAFSQTTIDGYRSDVFTARGAIDTSIGSIADVGENLRTTEAALALEKEELALKKAGSTLEDIRIQEAKVADARSSVRRYQADFAKTVLRAPINGIIAKREAEVGEIVPAQTTVVVLVSPQTFTITTDVPEADITKIAVGDTAHVTLDAYDRDVIFNATVTHIDPTETIIDGVPTYETLLAFTEPDPRIKSGMTANIDINTAEKKQTIAVPQRAIIWSDTQREVRILTPENTIRLQPVTTGIRGSDGYIEILDGIIEGDRVITFIKE